MPYTYAMSTPKYDSGAYSLGSNREIAKNRNKYPNSPITTLIPSDHDNELFNFIPIICGKNPTDRIPAPKKYDKKI